MTFDPRFIGHLLKLLMCNNEKFGPQIQKHVKELVGHELNPAIYAILFDQIKLFVDKFFDQSGQVCMIRAIFENLVWCVARQVWWLFFVDLRLCFPLRIGFVILWSVL